MKSSVAPYSGIRVKTASKQFGHRGIVGHEAAATADRKLVLSLLGGFHAALGSGRELAIHSRKDQALLAYLALAPNLRHSRSKLASLLWSEYDDRSARHSLRQALSSLRRIVGDSVLVSDRNLVSLKADRIQVDVREFVRLCSEA